MNELDRRRDIRRFDVDLQEGPVADPGLIFHLDRVVAETDDEIGGTQELRWTWRHARSMQPSESG